MSMVRRYNNVLINLTKVISVERINSTLYFTTPLSNNLIGNMFVFLDPKTHNVMLSSHEEAEKELADIHNTLNEYHKK